jgi:YHS domain-containing protein
MTLLSWIVRLLIIVMIVRFVVSLFTSGRRPAPAQRRPAQPQERIGGTLVRDPQCGTYLPQERAIAASGGGGTEYFCSSACRDAWASRRA